MYKKSTHKIFIFQLKKSKKDPEFSYKKLLDTLFNLKIFRLIITKFLGNLKLLNYLCLVDETFEAKTKESPYHGNSTERRYHRAKSSVGS